MLNTVRRKLFGPSLNSIDTAQLIELPDNAQEIELCSDLFKVMEVDGYCLMRHQLEWFSKYMHWMLNGMTISPLTIRLRKEIEKFDDEVKALHEKTELVCVISDGPFYKVADEMICPWKTSLINHERCHCLTLQHSQLWHRIVDGVMLKKFGSKWLRMTHHVVELPCHELLRQGYGDAWVTVTEAMARIAAVLSVDEVYRKRIAYNQLPRQSQQLFDIAHQFAEEYSSIQNFINTIDTIEQAIVKK